jgi:hypothetical protein
MAWKCLGKGCPGCSTCDKLRTGPDARFGKPMKNVTPKIVSAGLSK